MMPEKNRITIETLEDGVLCRKRIIATIYGSWAFHPNYEGPGWQVTHVPSGKNLFAVADHFAYREAMQIVAQLGPLELTFAVGPAGVIDADTQHIIQAIVGRVLGG